MTCIVAAAHLPIFPSSSNGLWGGSRQRHWPGQAPRCAWDRATAVPTLCSRRQVAHLHSRGRMRQRLAGRVVVWGGDNLGGLQ